MLLNQLNNQNHLEERLDNYVNRKDNNTNNNKNEIIENVCYEDKSSIISERDVSSREEINIINSLKKLFLFKDLNEKEM